MKLVQRQCQTLLRLCSSCKEDVPLIQFDRPLYDGDSCRPCKREALHKKLEAQGYFCRDDGHIWRDNGNGEYYGYDELLDVFNDRLD